MTTLTTPGAPQGSGPAPTSTTRGAHLPSAKSAIQGQRLGQRSGQRGAKSPPAPPTAKKPKKPTKKR